MLEMTKRQRRQIKKKGSKTYLSTEIRNSFLLKMVNDQNEICHYCKGRMKIKSDNPFDTSLASIEHLYSKLDIRRYLNESTVATCKKCNWEKAHEEQRQINKLCPSYKQKYYKSLVRSLLNNEKETRWFKN